MAHTFTTTVASDDGSFTAEVFSLPQLFVGTASDEQGGRLGVEPPARLTRLARDLGAEVGAQVSEANLRDLLTQLAHETGASRRASQSAIQEVVQALALEPVVVVEESPAIGRSLIGLLSQGFPAYVLVVEGKPLLALLTEVGLVVAWFAAGPLIGAREGLREGTQEATRKVSAELLERWMRERFSRSRRRGR